MKLCALALAAALLVPFTRSAGAQDASSGAIAAAVAAAAPSAAAPETDAPKKEEAKPKKKAAKGKKKPEGESKYKSRALSENSESHYRFDENGNPIVKKKPAPKLKKKSSPPEDAEDKPSCSAEEPCSDKKSSDADAL